MSKYIILGNYEPLVIEAESWEDAFWAGFEYYKDSLMSITKIPHEDGDGDA